MGRIAELRKFRGTTLIELLVVIVIFLIGILAVVQIFPKGFQLLVTTRNNSVAAHLAEDEVERIKQHADQLPQEILAVHYVNGVPVQDATRNPYDLGPQGDAVNSAGLLSLAGTNIGNWLLYSGPNSFRRVVAEGSRVPAPRQVGSNYGGLMVLNFGPIDPNPTTTATNPTPNVTAYANDLVKNLVLPDNLVEGAGENITVGIGTDNVSSPLYDSSNTLPGSDYYVSDPTASDATLLLPTNSTFNRTYHLRFAAYITSAGSTLRVNYPDLLITVPYTTATDASGNLYPLVAVPVQTILQDLGQLGTGQSFAEVDYDSLQVAPVYALVPNTTAFTTDPLQYKLLDPNIGVLLFNPVGYSSFVEQPGGAREPLEARVDYDVYDWRILRQETRLDVESNPNSNGNYYGQFPLPLQSIKVGTASGPDGLNNGGIGVYSSTGVAPTDLQNFANYSGSSSPYPSSWDTSTIYQGTQSSNADNLVLIDLQTGGVVYEVSPTSGAQLVSINKSTGMVTISSDSTTAGTVTGYLAIPGSTGYTTVNLVGRSLRALYRARQEFSVSVLKSAALYSLVEPPTGNQTLGEGQVYTPANSNGILVFPTSDLHQQVVIDTINYTDPSGGFDILHGQSFQIEPVNGFPLPEVNLAAVLPSGSTITGVSGIKGASLIVQVLWNPDQFHLGSTGTANITAIDNWEHGWRRNAVETTIPSLELQ